MRWPLPATIALLVTVLAPGAALSEPTPRSHATRAGMYVEALDTGSIQVRRRLCDRPQREDQCHRMSRSLKAAIDEEHDGTIEWVRRMWPYRGKYYVLGPIQFGSDRAVFKYLWRDMESEGGCGGHGRVFFRQTRDGWRSYRHSGVAACPA